MATVQKPRLSALLVSVLALAAVATSAAESRGWKYTVLSNFSGGTDGQYPTADLSLDRAGNLYGTTLEGGGSGSGDNCLNGCGVVFKLSPDGTETILHSFTGNPDGAFPYGGVIVNSSTGVLTGTTGEGGTKCFTVGCGVIYQVTQDGTETVLHSFNNQTMAQAPRRA